MTKVKVPENTSVRRPRASSPSRSPEGDELAVLVYDSACDDSLAGSTGSAGRHFTFQARDLTLEARAVGTLMLALTCQVVPPQAAALEVRHRRGSTELARDDYGVFHLSSLPAGMVSLRVFAEEGSRSIATSPITIGGPDPGADGSPLISNNRAASHSR